MNIAEIREKYPQYNNASDAQLADALHAKYYSHVPKEQFYSKIGYSTEPEQSFLNKLPRNIAAGLTRGAAGLANIPYDIASMGGGGRGQGPEEQQLMQALGEKSQQPNAERIPHFGEHDYSKMYGITGQPTTADQAIQMASEFALPIGGAARGGATTLRAIGHAIADLPLTRGMAARSLRQARNAAVERGVERLPIDREVLRDTRQFLPNTAPYRNLLQEAMRGNYDPLFTLQSDLGAQARQLTRSSSGAERLHGIEAHNTRQRLLDSMRNALAQSGHEDIANMMQHGQNRYRQYHTTKRLLYDPATKVAKETAKYAGIPLSLAGIMKALYSAGSE